MTSTHSPIPAGDLVTVQREDLFNHVRFAFIAGESWRRRNDMPAQGNHEYVGKAAYDYADAATSPLAASPAHATGAAMREILPRYSGKGGWTLDFDFLQELQKEVAQHEPQAAHVMLEDVQAIALATERRVLAALSSPAPEGEAAQGVEPVTGVIAAARAFFEAFEQEPEKDCWDTETGEPEEGAQRFASDWSWADYHERVQKARDNLRAAVFAPPSATQEEAGRG